MLLGLVMFVSAMGSFTHGPGPLYYGGKVIMWVWNPLVMMMVERRNLEFARSPVIGPFIGPVQWSIMLGLIAGLMRGTLSKPNRNSQVAPGSNPELIRTPLAHDSGFTDGKTDSVEQQNQAEQSGGGYGNKPVN